MLFAPRAPGIGLTGLLVIIAILYFTGAGAWLWERMRNLEFNCYDGLAAMGTSMGSGFCEGMGDLIASIDETAAGMIETVEGWFSDNVPYEAQQRIDDMQQFSQSLWDRVSDGTAGSFGSPAGRLEELMREGPNVRLGGRSAADYLRNSLDQFTIGQRYLSDYAPHKAVAWFQQGAQQPGGYGVLSQLTLGDMYRTGSYGVKADPQMASRYYYQAQQSIGTLQQSGTPEAGRLLSSLPASPDAIRQQLDVTIRQLQHR